MTGAIVVTWGTPVRGREAKGLEVFGKAIGYFSDLAKKGRVHGHREYIAQTGNVSEFSGMQIIDGDYEELVKLQGDEDYQKLIAQASAIVENFTVRLCTGGSDAAVQEQVALFAETLSTLGYL